MYTPYYIYIYIYHKYIHVAAWAAWLAAAQRSVARCINLASTASADNSNNIDYYYYYYYYY